VRKQTNKAPMRARARARAHTHTHTHKTIFSSSLFIFFKKWAFIIYFNVEKERGG